MFNAALQGFVFGLSLIVAIGAQNAFVLKQGLKGTHVFWVCFVCAFCDAILIALGVFGLDLVENSVPNIAIYAKYFGAIFLFFYGLRSFYSAFTKNQILNPDNHQAEALWPTLLICLALTWLNPHVYLDTVILLGSISIKFGEQSHYFGIGAIVSSFVFFFSLGYGARVLRPLFAKPVTWKVLDVIIGTIMWLIAYSLLV